MASRQQSPGVQILERDLSTSSSVSLTNVGAIAAAFENGPIEEPVTIGSERELALSLATLQKRITKTGSQRKPVPPVWW